MRATRLILAAVLTLALCLAGAAAQAGGKALIEKGNQAAMKGKMDQAAALYTKAIEAGDLKKANLSVAYSNRGSARDELGQPTEALGDFTKALELDPKNAEAYYNRSFLYEKEGLIKLAKEDMTRAVRLKPRDADYTERLKYLQFKLGEYLPKTK